MKKMKKFLSLAFLAAAILPRVFAQSSSGISVEVRSAYFNVTSDLGSYDAETLLREMELRFEVYNRLFRFNTAGFTPLRVRAISNKAEYDSYIMDRLGVYRNGAVYLHYTNPASRELVINRGSAEEANMLPHQAFIQFYAHLSRSRRCGCGKALRYTSIR